MKLINGEEMIILQNRFQFYFSSKRSENCTNGNQDLVHEYNAIYII